MILCCKSFSVVTFLFVGLKFWQGYCSMNTQEIMSKISQILILMLFPVDSRHPSGELDYSRDFWQPLSHTIDAFLHPSIQTSPISFQETFTLVYKCVGEGHSDRLHSDLMQAVTKYLKTLHVELLKCSTSDNDGRQVRETIIDPNNQELFLSDSLSVIILLFFSS